MANDKLPEEIRQQIDTEADKYGFVVPYDGSNKFYNEGKVKGYQAGATAWAEWKVRYDELKDSAEKLRLALVMAVFALKQSYDVTDYPADGQTNQDSAIRIGEEALQQFKDGGKGKEFAGSNFTSPAPGITLGCISPEARQLLDTIMEAWEKHYTGMKQMHGDAMPETTFYGFAYWLVRWSGIIESITNPTI